MSEPAGFQPYQPEPQLPVTPPPAPRAVPRGHRVGQAVGVQTRVELYGREGGSVTVLTFRIFDGSGGPPAEVELRSRSLSGSVQEGDWVQFDDQRAKSGRYQVDRLLNLTTGAAVETSGGVPKGVRVVLATLFVLFFVVVLGFIIVGVVMMASSS